MNPFARVGRLFGVEWLKLRRGRLLRVGLAATALVGLLAALTHDPLPHSSGWTIAIHTLSTSFFAAEVFLLVLGATALSGEATGGTMKMILPHAYRRGEWVVAKALVLVLAALLFAVTATSVATIHAAATKGLGDVTKESEPLFGEEAGTVEVFQPAATMRSHLAETVATSFGALVATAFLGVLLSCVFNHVVPSLCAAFLLYGTVKYADFLLGLPREANQWLYAWYPAQLSEVTGKLGRALNERWDDALASAGLLRSGLTALASVVLGAAVFSNRDLHV
jgi:hypothetical protein